MLNVHVGLDGRTARVTARGEVDLSTAGMLKSAIDDACGAHGVTAVVLDLTGVSFLGGTGLAVLLKAKQKCATRDLTLALHGSKPVQRTVEISGLADDLPVQPAPP